MSAYSFGNFISSNEYENGRLANKVLFEPLGIAGHKNYYAQTAEENKAFTIGKTPKENIWLSDPDRLGTPGYGLCMSAEDMAKIGLLCLGNGSYNGKQVVSSEWITEMTYPRTIESDRFRGMDYGYLCWIIDRQKNIYAAIGNSGKSNIGSKENTPIENLIHKLHS